MSEQGKPTEPTETFCEMAKKIKRLYLPGENGMLSILGGDRTVECRTIADAIEDAEELRRRWPDFDPANGKEQSNVRNWIKSVAKARYVPLVNTLAVTSAEDMFAGAQALVTIPLLDFSRSLSFKGMFRDCLTLNEIPLINTSRGTNFYAMFASASSMRRLPALDVSNSLNMGYFINGCSSLEVLPPLDTAKVTNMTYMINNSNLRRIESLDFSSVTSMNNLNAPAQYIRVLNIGKSSLTSYPLSGFSAWGTGSDENRQSLIDSLLIYSYDRAANEMPTATIILSANTKALLTDSEIAAITAKGFTIA